MYNYKIIELVLSNLYTQIHTPYMLLKSNSLISNINYACPIQFMDDPTTFLAFPHFIYNSPSVNEEKNEKTENEDSTKNQETTSLITVDITYFIALRIKKTKSMKKEDIEKYFITKIKEIVTTYFEADLNHVLMRAKYPPLYSLAYETSK